MFKKKMGTKIMLYTGVISAISGAAGSVYDLVNKILAKPVLISSGRGAGVLDDKKMGMISTFNFPLQEESSSFVFIAGLVLIAGIFLIIGAVLLDRHNKSGTRGCTGPGDTPGDTGEGSCV